MKTYKTIEYARGATYASNKFAVYEHGVYPRWSVLAGQPSRKWLDEFDTLEEAKAAYPKASVCTGISTYRPPSLDHFHDNDIY